MGYTHYFRRPSTLDALRFSFFVDDVRAIVAALPEAAALSDVDITPDGVTFNGKPPADYETFAIDRVLPLRPRWNDTDEKGPTGEPLVFACCKTAQRPYDLAVCAVLLRFARHFPGAVVTSDGTPEDWADALALVARTFPRDPSPIRVIDKRGSGSQLVPHDDPRPTHDAEWRDAWAKIDALTGDARADHNRRLKDLVADGVDYCDAVVRSAREARERQIQPTLDPATPGTSDASISSIPGPDSPAIDSAPGVTLRANPQRGGIELHFNAKPPVATRDALKSAGWRWSGASSCWYRSDTPDARAFALDVVASFRTGTPGTAETPAPTPARDPAPRQIQQTKPAAATLSDYYHERAERFARDAADLERPSTQNYTPKRGRQQAVKRHDAANLRRAERAARALARAWSQAELQCDVDPRTPDDFKPAALRDKLTAKQLCAYTRTRGVSNGYYHWADAHEPADTSAPAVALRALVDAFDVNARADDAKRKADAELREKIDALRGLQIDGFFPSPPAVVRRVVELADLSPGLSVLEPSAGLGDLAEAARAAGCSVRCVERLLPAVQILRARGFETIDADFLDMLPDAGDEHFADRRADRVLMNPPFERGAAMKHVLHALKFVKPGGKLVAVLPGSVSPTDVELDLATLPADLVDSWELSDPVAGAFDTPDAFRRTGVAVCYLTIDRAETPTQANATPATVAPTDDARATPDALDDAPAAAPAAGPAVSIDRPTPAPTPAAPRQCDHCGRRLTADAVRRHEAHACDDGKTRCARCYVLQLEDVARASDPPAPAAGPAGRRTVDVSFYTPVVADPTPAPAGQSALSSLIANLRARHA